MNFAIHQLKNIVLLITNKVNGYLFKIQTRLPYIA